MLFTYFATIMLDMKYIVGTTTALISIQPVMETVGYIAGSFVGLTYKWLNRQLVMTLSFIAVCAVSAVYPLVHQLWLVFVMAFVVGFGTSINAGGYIVWTIDQWKEKSVSVLQINALGYGLGSVIVTAVLGPYLTGEPKLNKNEYGPNNTTNATDAPNEHITAHDRSDKLIWPSVILWVVLASSKNSFCLNYKTVEILNLVGSIKRISEQRISPRLNRP